MPLSTDEAALDAVLGKIRPVDSNWIDRARRYQVQLTKPEGSLGRLEEIANRLCGIQQTLRPSVNRPHILLFAADHGVCDEGVSAYPQAVTAQMVTNFLSGGAAINALARANGVELSVVDVGVRSRFEDHPDLIRRPIAAGTRNLAREPAMSAEQTLGAIATGLDIANRAIKAGSQLLGIGEMGIGNTTAAAALTAMLTGREPKEVVGRGTGVDNEHLRQKVAVVEQAVRLHSALIGRPLHILSAVGGFEIAAMCGVCLAGATQKTAVVVDGFIATAAAAVAVGLRADVRDYLFASHRSPEPGQAALFDHLSHSPLLDLAMRLGEGTGAALAMTLIRSAAAAFTEMATFGSASVSQATEEA